MEQLSTADKSSYNANRQRINPNQKLPVVLVNDLPPSQPAVLALDMVISPTGVLTIDFDIYKKSDIEQEEMAKCYWVGNALHGINAIEGYGAKWRAYIPSPNIVTRESYITWTKTLAQFVSDTKTMIPKFKDQRWIYQVEALESNDEAAIKALNATGFNKLNDKLNELFQQFSVFDFESLEGYQPMTARKFLTSLEPEYTNQYFDVMTDDSDGAFRVSFDGLNGYSISAKEDRFAFKFKDGKKGYWGTYDLDIEKDRILIRMLDAAKSQGYYLTGFNRAMDHILKPIKKYITDHNLEERKIYEEYVAREAILQDAQKLLVNPNGLSSENVSTECKLGRALLPPTPVPVVEIEEVSDKEQKEIEKKAATRAKKPRATTKRSPSSTRGYTRKTSPKAKAKE